MLYALGEFSGGVTCYVKDGVLSYECNLFEIERTRIKAKDKQVREAVATSHRASVSLDAKHQIRL